MNTIKWELEDLSFAIAATRRCTTRSSGWSPSGRPSRDAVPGRGHRRRSPATCARRKIKADGDRPAQALLLDLPEDDRRAAATSTTSTTWSASGSWSTTVRDCYAVARASCTRGGAGAGPVQGLHRDAEVQHVPVAAHHGDRPRGQAGRDADPHPRHAPHAPSTASPRTGSTRRTQPARQRARRRPAAIDDMAWLRQLLDWQREAADPGEFLESLRFDLGAAARSSSSPPRAT